MSEAKPKPFLSLELRCGCGGALFVEMPQEAASSYLGEKLLSLGTAWTNAHAAHHQEPKK